MRKSVCFSLIAIFIFIAIIAFAVPFHTTAEAYSAFTGEITVKQDNDGYYYHYNSVDDDTRYDTLQGLITYLETTQSNSDTPGANLRLFFNDIRSSSRITLSKSCVMTGIVTFEISEYDSSCNFAICTNNSLQFNAELYSENMACGIKSNGTFTMNGGRIVITNCNPNDSNSCGVLVNIGNATFNNGAITNDTGCGILLFGGSASTTISTLTISAPTSVYAIQGSITINGGTYNNVDNGCSLSINNSANATINGGTYNAPIHYNSTSTASLAINAGTFNAPLTLAQLTPYNGSVKVKDLNITPSSQCIINVKLNNFASDYVTFDSIAVNGYYATKYVIDDTPYDLDAPLYLTTNADKTVTFNASNVYYLSVYVNGVRQIYQDYQYNASVQCADLDVSIPDGYTLTGWRKNGSLQQVTSVKMNADMRLDAVLALDECVISVDNSYVFTYNGTGHAVTATVTHGFGNNVDDQPTIFYYQWQKKFGDNDYREIDGATTRTLTVSNVADSGVYRFYANVTDGVKYAETAYSGDITVTVNKGTYTLDDLPEIPSFAATYADNLTLGYNFAFEVAGFSWINTSQMPTCAVTAYPAKYNGDTDNYNDYYLDVTVTLSKATPDVPSPLPAPNVTYTPTLTLADIDLPEHFSWEDPTIVPTMGTDSYQAVYDCNSVNYITVTRSLSVTVNKADYTDITFEPLPSQRFSSNFRELDDLDAYIQTNRPNWRLKNAGSDYMSIGTHTYACVYNADSAHYNDFETNIEFSLDKGIIGGNWAHDAVSVPFGDELGTISLNANFRWADPTTVPLYSGEYPAYYNNNPAYFEDYELTVAVTVIKADYTPSDVPPHDIDPIVYSPTRTLADVALPDNFTWVDATVVPTVAVTRYAARYCADINHNPYDLDIDLTVTRAPLQAPVFADTTIVYDGQEHELLASNIDPLVTITGYEDNKRTAVGITNAKAFVTQSDSDNYVVLPATLHAKLTITKAPSIITAPSRVDVKVGGQLNIIATVNNTEQSVIIPAVDTNVAGAYDVTLRTEESGNYLAGSLVITVCVDPIEATIGYIEYPDDYDFKEYFGSITAEDGVPVDAEVKFLPTENMDGVTLSVGTGSDALYTVKLLLPEEMRKANFTLIRNGEVIEYKIENGAYLVFEAKDGDTVYFNAVKKPFVWYWIPPVAAVLVAGVVLFILYKKKILFNRPKKVESIDEPDLSEKTDQE